MSPLEADLTVEPEVRRMSPLEADLTVEPGLRRMQQVGAVSSVAIAAVGVPDLPDLLPLIADYQRFYGVEPDGVRNAAYFGQLATEPTRGIQFLARGADGEPLGFATLYVLPSSLGAGTSCVLNDLFTTPGSRRQGVARRLIEWAMAHARQAGYARLEWQTQDGNTSARALYEALGATSSPWRCYAIDLPSTP